MEKPTIENLMKVSLSVDVRDTDAGNPLPAAFEFIYGIGSAGISPFEKQLFGKNVGDQAHYEIGPTEFEQTMGHLALPLFEQTGITSSQRLTVVVTHVVRAEDREVVKAMAGGGSCSDCGCGCGGH